MLSQEANQEQSCTSFTWQSQQCGNEAVMWINSLWKEDAVKNKNENLEFYFEAVPRINIKYLVKL